MKPLLFTYAVSWVCVKYGTFAKGWDNMTVSVTAIAVMLAGILLFDFVKSLLMNGKDGILYTAVMILGGIVFIGDEFFHVGWYLEFGNPTADMLIGWGLAAGLSLVVAYVSYLRLTGSNEKEG